MAEHTGNDARRHISDDQALRGKSMVAAIDFHRTRLYPTDASPGHRPERVADVDPQGHSREIAHKAGNPDGTYEAGNQDYWREITDTLTDDHVLRLGQRYFGWDPARTGKA